MGYDDNTVNEKTRWRGRSALMGDCEPTGLGGSGSQPPPVAAAHAMTWWGLGYFFLEVVTVVEAVGNEALEEAKGTPHRLMEGPTGTPRESQT